MTFRPFQCRISPGDGAHSVLYRRYSPEAASSNRLNAPPGRRCLCCPSLATVAEFEAVKTVEIRDLDGYQQLGAAWGCTVGGSSPAGVQQAASSRDGWAGEGTSPELSYSIAMMLQPGPHGTATTGVTILGRGRHGAFVENSTPAKPQQDGQTYCAFRVRVGGMGRQRSLAWCEVAVSRYVVPRSRAGPASKQQEDYNLRSSVKSLTLARRDES
ncbi:hypothetical protein CMUS01_07368 [Colletotrichum musicola]|uniref:Uncharacterized protein n=1 Tax=Colletotrichum musicola TaxID=2175873 RepID=A0A8H6NFF0_9PEZI|nr:hypothetical protein CMUS01_07368 [Colletotrichum musicola]